MRYACRKRNNCCCSRGHLPRALFAVTYSYVVVSIIANLIITSRLLFATAVNSSYSWRNARGIVRVVIIGRRFYRGTSVRYSLRSVGRSSLKRSFAIAIYFLFPEPRRHHVRRRWRRTTATRSAQCPVRLNAQETFVAGRRRRRDDLWFSRARTPSLRAGWQRTSR